MNTEQLLRAGKVAAAIVGLLAAGAVMKGVVNADTNREINSLKVSVQNLTETVALTAYIVAEPDSSLRAQAVNDLRRARYMQQRTR